MSRQGRAQEREGNVPGYFRVSATKEENHRECDEDIDTSPQTVHNDDNCREGARELCRIGITSASSSH